MDYYFLFHDSMHPSTICECKPTSKNIKYFGGMIAITSS